MECKYCGNEMDNICFVEGCREDYVVEWCSNCGSTCDYYAGRKSSGPNDKNWNRPKLMERKEC